MSDKKPTYEELENQIAGLKAEIDNRILAETVLRESEMRFRQIVENAVEWIWEVDVAGLYTYASPVVESFLEYSPDEIVGKKYFFDLFHSDEREQLKEIAFEFFSRKQPFRDFINRNISKNGKEIWLSTSGVPILDGNGNLLGYRGADMDVTSQKKIMEALAKSESNYRAIFDSANDAIFVHDTQTGAILDVNRKMTEMYGFSPEEARTIDVESISEGTPPYSQQEALTWIRKAVAGEPQLFEWRARDRSGRCFWVEVNLKRVSILDEDCLLAIVRDITVRKQHEEDSIRARKEAEFYLDLMTHDLTNFNQVALGNLSLLEKTSLLDDKQKKYLNNCKRQIVKSETLISKGRALAGVIHLDKNSLVPIDLNKYILSAVSVVNTLYPSKTIEFVFSPSGDKKALGTELLESVLMNLIENAVKHTPDHQVWVSISVSDAAADPLRFWEISIEDKGPGVPDTFKESIFQRFNKIDEERGIGLGLSLARAIMDHFGGSIRVEDRVLGDPSRGCAFKIILAKA